MSLLLRRTRPADMRRLRDPLLLCFLGLGVVLSVSLIHLAVWFHRLPRSVWRQVRFCDLPDAFGLYVVLVCQLLPICAIGWGIRFWEWRQLPEQCRRLLRPGGGWRRAVRQRLTTRHCPVCGYDTRCSDGICTECGFPAPVASRRTLPMRAPPASPPRQPKVHRRTPRAASPRSDRRIA